ncbi:MAG: hemolysin family protein [Gemmatimonadota bacterium]
MNPAALAALIVVAAAGVVVSALLTLVETAIFSLGPARLRTLEEEGFHDHERLIGLRERPVYPLVLLRFGTASADAATAACLGVAGYAGAGPLGAAAGFVVAALAILTLGSLWPARYAAGRNVRVALAAAPWLDRAARVARPALAPFRAFVEGLPETSSGLMEVEPEDEIRQLASLGSDEGVIDDTERLLLERAFRLDETQAHEVMTPRVDVFAWRESMTLGDIASELALVPFSRIPVYGESIDEVTGVLYVRDAYQALLRDRKDVALSDLAREPLVVPGSIRLTGLLGEFQARRIHLAVVMDEYGGTDGIVTLEDILEELVGEIVDETDIAEEPILRLSRSEIVADGDVDLRELNHRFNARFPLLEHRSLNGYVLEELGHVPSVGERLVREGIEIEVVEASETHVIRARLRRQQPMPDLAADTRSLQEATRPGR